MASVEAFFVAVEPMIVEPVDDGCTKNGGVLNSPVRRPHGPRIRALDDDFGSIVPKPPCERFCYRLGPKRPGHGPPGHRRELCPTYQNSGFRTEPPHTPKTEKAAILSEDGTSAVSGGS